MADKSLEKWFGLHERLDTPALRELLQSYGLKELARWSQKLPPDEIASAIAAHLSNLLSHLTLTLREKDRSASEKALEQLRTVLQEIDHPFSDLAPAVPLPPFRQLMEIIKPEEHAVRRADNIRPDLPLGVSALLTGASRSPSLISQISKELLSADRADWLVSFIKWSGIRPLRDILVRFTEKQSSLGETRLRVATTSYLGATDPKAIEFLLNLPNTEVRVSYDTHRTRLHAKAYLFHRATGFGSAYIGSANVSRFALDEGLEWTAKISEHELPYLWRQIVAAFDSHWEDPGEFEPLYTDDFGRFKDALLSEKSTPSSARPEASFQFFELRPYGYQQEILDEIASERHAGIHRHLIIAATGTGKTMVAAFDYLRFAANAKNNSRPSLLFIAHREEILRQSLGTFRHVLRDEGFGDLLVGGAEPTQSRYLFCSVQSWHSRNLDRLDPDFFDYVVFDEAHHAAASSYQAILNHLRPRVLLGLTATPERSDGRDIREDFGGRFTHEIRLPDAVDRRLLVPFHYFGIADHDSIDLSQLNWRRGGYLQNDLEKVIGANDMRAKWVLRQTLEYVTDASTIRGLGFCVSRAHARFMANRFSQWGMPSAVLTADSSKTERLTIQRKLVLRQIRFIFTVDLYNEGVDIPEIDTILLLRPTESLTVYLQQLGRGLRLHEEKPHLTVLDFIAPQNRQFRYADRFRAMSSQPDKRIDDQIATSFPWLPSGCLVSLDRIAKETILDNIRQNLGIRKPRLVQQLALCRQHYSDRPTFQNILDWLHFDDADDLLRHGIPCRLLEAAGGDPCSGLAPYEKGLQLGLRQLGMLTDVGVLTALAGRLRESTPPPVADLSVETRTRLTLAHSVLWGKDKPGDGSLVSVDTFIRTHTALRQDLEEVIDYRLEQTVPASGIGLREQTGVLELHASYTREQILLALGKGSLEAPFSHREGLLHLPDKRVDVLFVTINKAESEFSPTTMYEDYAVTESLFHWQTQSRVGPDSPTGQRYIKHAELDYTPVLFVRPTKRLENGLTAPFFYCGPLRYVRHEGSHPMSILWRFEHPLRARIFRLSHRDVA